MASCNAVQIVNPSVLSRIESFMNDTSYRDAIENSATYNTRLCIERRLRMPFLDSQTGVAQNHSALFMSPRERLPGLSEGQVYTYPSRRWRKRRRQYLMQPQVAPRILQRREVVDPATDGDLHTISTVENPAVVSMGSGGGGSGGGGGSVGGGSSCGGGEDSKESIKEETPKVSEAWFYDELDLHAMDGFDEPDPDSDYDYEESYSKRKKKRASAPKPSRSSTTPSEAPTPKRSKAPGPGRGRKKGVNYSELTDADKPFACELCGARYKTRPGLTYHYTHSHKDRGMVAVGVGVSMGPSEEEISCESSCASMICPGSPPTKDTGTLATGLGPVQGWSKFQDSYLTFLNAPGGSSGKKSRSSRSGGGVSDGGGPGPSVAPPPVLIEEVVTPMSPPPPTLHERKLPMQEEQVLVMEQNEKERAAPSPYCDFCLGDAVANKKSGQPEELVSCSDCGRSGHPTCLQFTDNMIISVRKYRWQCIECKCCSICGTSDNDDQLLFCDDCDRGYHMYCLAPPLHTPPEGSWSCRLCILEFHSK